MGREAEMGLTKLFLGCELVGMVLLLVFKRADAQGCGKVFNYSGDFFLKV